MSQHCSIFRHPYQHLLCGFPLDPYFYINCAMFSQTNCYLGWWRQSISIINDNSTEYDSLIIWSCKTESSDIGCNINSISHSYNIQFHEIIVVKHERPANYLTLSGNVFRVRRLEQGAAGASFKGSPKKRKNLLTQLGDPQNGWFMENPLKMDDMGYPHFRNTNTIWFNVCKQGGK